MPIAIRIATMPNAVSTSRNVMPRWLPIRCFNLPPMSTAYASNLAPSWLPRLYGIRSPALRFASQNREALCRDGELHPHQSAPPCDRRINREARTVFLRDLADDRQSQPASGPPGAGPSIEALAHARALSFRNARTVVLDFEI